MSTELSVTYGSVPILHNTTGNGSWTMPTKDKAMNGDIQINLSTTTDDNFYDSNGDIVAGTIVTTITVPSTVTSIGVDAFGCRGLTELHMEPTTPPIVPDGAITDIPAGCTIYVPVGTLADYQAATGWSAVASQMQEETA